MQIGLFIYQFPSFLIAYSPLSETLLFEMRDGILQPRSQETFLPQRH